MSAAEHTFDVTVTWTGDTGEGTRSYGGYSRAHEISAPGRSAIESSSDPAFRGDGNRWNPELLFVAALSSCHKLWYLHLCAQSGIAVVDYVDEASGTMVIDDDGGGRFTSVTLRPRVTITSDSDAATAAALHAVAGDKCFIANSVNVPVEHRPTIAVTGKRPIANSGVPHR